jgi:hypothetical protein
MKTRLTLAAAMILASATLHAAESDPGADFARATRAFASQEYARAAQEIRNGGAFVQRQASRAAGATKQALNAAATDLNALAAGIEKGAVRDRAALESAFTRAKNALDASRRDTPWPSPGPG